MKFLDVAVLGVAAIALVVLIYGFVFLVPPAPSDGSGHVANTTIAVTQNTSQPAASDAAPVMLSGVPDVMQSQSWSCGAGSFRAVLNYYGISAIESGVISLLNTTPSHGTYPWDMVNASEKLGFSGEWRENLTLADVHASLEQGVPVIIDGQRFKDANKTWDDTWDTGHYMVIYGLDNETVYLEDPAVQGSRLAIPRDTFVSLWHDYESELPVPADAHKYYHIGVFIRGTVPSDRPEYINITDNYQFLEDGRVVVI